MCVDTVPGRDDKLSATVISGFSYWQYYFAFTGPAGGRSRTK
jgi:hypothetical protein